MIMFVLQVLFPVPEDRTAAKQKAAAHCSFKSFYKTQFLMHLKHLQYLPGETPKPSRLKYTEQSSYLENLNTD